MSENRLRWRQRITKPPGLAKDEICSCHAASRNQGNRLSSNDLLACQGRTVAALTRIPERRAAPLSNQPSDKMTYFSAKLDGAGICQEVIRCQIISRPI